MYEVIIRTKVINRGSMQVNKMHKQSSELVKAGTQAELIRPSRTCLPRRNMPCSSGGAMQNQPHQPRTLLSLITACHRNGSPGRVAVPETGIQQAGISDKPGT